MLSDQGRDAVRAGLAIIRVLGSGRCGCFRLRRTVSPLCSVGQESAASPRSLRRCARDQLAMVHEGMRTRSSVSGESQQQRGIVTPRALALTLESNCALTNHTRQRVPVPAGCTEICRCGDLWLWIVAVRRSSKLPLFQTSTSTSLDSLHHERQAVAPQPCVSR